MRRLPQKILISFVEKHKKEFGFKIHLPKEQLISQILQKVPKEIVLQQLYAPYGWAGNVTIHLFKVTGMMLNKEFSKNRLTDVLKNLESGRSLTNFPEPVDINLSDHEIRIRHEFLGEPIVYQDPETHELQTVRPLMTLFSIIHLPSGFTEIRVRERVYALNAAKLLKKYFKADYEELTFTRDHLGQWIDWATTLRNARFKPMGPISTLYMGAKEWLDLRKVDLFKEWWNKGEPLEGVYIKFEVRSGEKVGFGVNAKMGKIMLRTFTSEEEVKFIIKEAQSILGL